MPLLLWGFVATVRGYERPKSVNLRTSLGVEVTPSGLLEVQGLPTHTELLAAVKAEGDDEDGPCGDTLDEDPNKEARDECVEKLRSDEALTCQDETFATHCKQLCGGCSNTGTCTNVNDTLCGEFIEANRHCNEAEVLENCMLACNRCPHDATFTDGVCVDDVTFVDVLGDTCAWYQTKDITGRPHCAGNEQTMGHIKGGVKTTAQVACCASCTPAALDMNNTELPDWPDGQAPEGNCHDPDVEWQDDPAWIDMWGDTCEWYGLEMDQGRSDMVGVSTKGRTNCEQYSNEVGDSNSPRPGVPVTEACCKSCRSFLLSEKSANEGYCGDDPTWLSVDDPPRGCDEFGPAEKGGAGCGAYPEGSHVHGKNLLGNDVVVNKACCLTCRESCQDCGIPGYRGPTPNTTAENNDWTICPTDNTNPLEAECNCGSAASSCPKDDYCWVGFACQSDVRCAAYTASYCPSTGCQVFNDHCVTYDEHERIIKQTWQMEVTMPDARKMQEDANVTAQKLRTLMVNEVCTVEASGCTFLKSNWMTMVKAWPVPTDESLWPFLANKDPAEAVAVDGPGSAYAITVHFEVDPEVPGTTPKMEKVYDILLKLSQDCTGSHCTLMAEIKSELGFHEPLITLQVGEPSCGDTNKACKPPQLPVEQDVVQSTGLSFGPTSHENSHLFGKSGCALTSPAGALGFASKGCGGLSALHDGKSCNVACNNGEGAHPPGIASLQCNAGAVLCQDASGRELECEKGRPVGMHFSCPCPLPTMSNGACVNREALVGGAVPSGQTCHVQCDEGYEYSFPNPVAVCVSGQMNLHGSCRKAGEKANAPAPAPVSGTEKVDEDDNGFNFSPPPTPAVKQPHSGPTACSCAEGVEFCQPQQLHAQVCAAHEVCDGAQKVCASKCAMHTPGFFSGGCPGYCHEAEGECRPSCPDYYDYVVYAGKIECKCNQPACEGVATVNGVDVDHPSSDLR